jgi:hypothetical protein
MYLVDHPPIHRHFQCKTPPTPDIHYLCMRCTGPVAFSRTTKGGGMGEGGEVNTSPTADYPAGCLLPS